MKHIKHINLNESESQEKFLKLDSLDNFYKFLYNVKNKNDINVEEAYSNAAENEGSNANVDLVDYDIRNVNLYEDKLVLELTNVITHQKGFGQEEIGDVLLILNLASSKWNFGIIK